MEKAKKDIIYKIMIYESTITDTILTKYGYSVIEIDELINEKIISKNDDNTYSLLDLDGFKEYGIELINIKYITEAVICFEKLYKMNPNDREVCSRVLVGKLQGKRINYKEVLEIFANLDKQAQDVNIFDNNLYLYLLSFITELPPEYKDREITDFIDLVNDKGIMREIKFEISKSKFTFAQKKLNSLINEYGNDTASNRLLSILLSRVIEYDKRFKRDLIERARNKQYAMIIKILEQKRETSYLSTLETEVLLICEAIVEVIRTDRIPKVTINYTSDTYEALIGKNFKLALELNEKFLARVNGNKANDILNILLVDLNRLIEDIKTEEQDLPLVAGQLSLQLSPNIDYSGYDAGDNEVDKKINEAEEIAYYIKSINQELNEAKNSMGIKSTTLLLIKLIYARDYYIEGNFTLGDILVHEVEKVVAKPAIVLDFLDKVKLYKANYKPKTSYSRKLIQNN